jgi:hypothetical protein
MYTSVNVMLCEKPFSLEIIGAAMDKESYTALANIRSWDIKNFFRSGKFVLPQSLRKKLKAALDTVEENGSSHNRQSAPCLHVESLFVNKAGFDECRICGYVFRN